MYFSKEVAELSNNWTRVYDTHEHFGFYWDYSKDAPPYGLRNVLNGAYVAPPSTMGNNYKQIGEFLQSKKGAETLNSLRAAFVDLYGVDIYPISPKKLEDLDEKIQEAYSGPISIYERLKKHGGVEKIILDNPPHLWDTWLHPSVTMTIRLDETIFPFSKTMYNEYRSNTENSKVFKYMHSEGLSLDTLDDFDDALEAYMFKLKKHASVIKIGTAYQRSLHFTLEENDDGKINDIYSRLIAGEASFSRKEMLRWGNYVVSIMLGFATIEQLPVQVHTGLALMKESDPRFLTDIVEQFSSARFDLFHGGYPYINQIAGMALTKGNVYVDLCWLPILSQSATKSLISQLIELGLSRKVHAYGGDCQNFEGSYGALLMTKNALAEVLLEKIDRSEINRDDAIEIGNYMLYENPKAFFG